MPYTDKYTKKNTPYQDEYEEDRAYFGKVIFGQVYFKGGKPYFRAEYDKKNTTYTDKY